MSAPVPPAARKERGICRRHDANGACADTLTVTWPDEPTTLLVLHGIGDQRSFTTLDTFALGLVGDEQERVAIEHRLVKGGEAEAKVPWFENSVRLTLKDDPARPPIDVHEYYWAHLSRASVPFDDILEFIRRTARSGAAYYTKDAKADVQNKEGFSPRVYFWLLHVVFAVASFWGLIAAGLDALLQRIPLVGGMLGGAVRRFLTGGPLLVRDAVGDVVAYVASDSRSPHFQTRQKILGGAVETLLRLIEAHRDSGRIIVAGHSLGSQIAVDAINRVNLLVCQGCVPGFDCEGRSASQPGRTIADVLSRLITFGSPVDKIAFFFRDVEEDEHPLRASLIENYHGFRQVRWPKGGLRAPVTATWQRRVFDTIPWVNYYCRKDLVSGAIDYFKDVENVRFVDLPGVFPHGAYWADPRFFGEIRRMIGDPRFDAAALRPPAPQPPAGELTFAWSVGGGVLLVFLAVLGVGGWLGVRWVLAWLGGDGAAG